MYLVLMYLFDDGLYMLGGDIVFYVFMLIVFMCLCSCFTLWYIDFDLHYEVIHGICLIFYVL